MKKPFDFSGWATRNNLKCSDGRVITKNAFADCDGKQVPLVWNHQHKEPFNVLGHAVLENKEDGVYSYCYFNDTDQGKNAKMLLEHGDISALSIYASELRQRGSDVLHGVIREVSLVLAGANPGAYIDNVVIAHGEDADGEAIIYTGEGIELYHADGGEKEEETPKKKEEKKEDEKSGKTIQDVIDTMNEEQQKVMYALVGEALNSGKGKKKEEDNDDDDEDGGKSAMKHNVFENNNYAPTNYLQHADQKAILDMAKSSAVGSFREALEIFAENNGMVLQHDATSGGFIQDPSQDGNVTWLFPEYKDVRPGAPELITNDQGWISVVMNKVHKSPISRIRTGQVDIRNIDALRAKGYEKGKEKSLSGNFKLVRRTTDPQTVYVRNALHRDDIIDITDFDYVQYLYNIDRMMLNEELATAIMLGDGREDSDPDKISPEHIRPIWTDDNLYTLHVDLDIDAAREELQGTETNSYFGDNYIYAEAMVNACLYLWTLPDPSPLQRASTSLLLVRLKSPGIVCFKAEAATA